MYEVFDCVHRCDTYVILQQSPWKDITDGNPPKVFHENLSTGLAREGLPQGGGGWARKQLRDDMQRVLRAGC